MEGAFEVIKDLLGGLSWDRESVYARLSQCIDSAIRSSLVIVLYKEGKEELIFANDMFYENIGEDRDGYEYKEADIKKRIKPENKVVKYEKCVEKSMLTGETQEIIYQFERYDGKVIWVRKRFAAICNGNSNDSVLNQYAKLVKMLQAYRNNNLAEAVTYYEGFDPSLFTDETVVSIANGVKQDIETNGYQTLEDLAYTMWSAGRMGEALADYQTCLAIRPANPKVIFSMGMIYRAQGETDKAVEMFTQIVTQYADSEQADKARQQLAELAPDNQQAAVPGQSIISQGETAADETAAGSGAETQAAQ